MNKKAKGYILGIIAAATYGMNPLFTLPLYQAGMNPDSVLFFRYLLAIPILAAMMRARGQRFALHREEVLPLLLAGVLVALSSLTLFQSYNYMDAGIASTLLFVYPVIVALMMALFFREKLTGKTLFCILFVAGGVGLLCKNGEGATLSLTGSLLAMVSAFSYAAYLVGASQTSLKNMPTLTVTCYVLLFGLFLFVFRLVFQETLYLPHAWYLWANLLALALFPTAVSFLCTNSAIQYIGSTPVAILGALEPVTAIFFGVTVFGETFTLRESVGLAMIIIAVTFVIAGGKRKEER
ncbi:MAG: DMT family transporter [Alistipes senegalensis]|nr:DMT family transporter [Oxalobacter formigenes]MCM1281167.1 DMT family transporter [Alistipes senegalensis]